MTQIKLNNFISYIPAVEKPILSADVGIIQSHDSIWLYDVGASANNLKFINEFIDKSRSVNIVASHFHEDHITNIYGINNYFNFYCSKYTANHLNSAFTAFNNINNSYKAPVDVHSQNDSSTASEEDLTGMDAVLKCSINVIENDLFIKDNDILIHLFILPSSHAKGCIGMEVNEEYVFIGDADYCMHKNGHITYNRQLLYDEIRKLKAIKAEKICVSHSEEFVQDKSKVISKLEKIMSFALPDNSYIYLS